MQKHWTIDELKEVVNKSKTIREVLRHFGLPANQGHYNRMFHKAVKEFDIDISHIMNENKTKKFPKKLPLEDILIKGVWRDTKNLKIRLLKEGILENKCSECSCEPEWNSKPLSLQLDHINGDNTDNRIENLRILCPNCHSQTETWGGKRNKSRHAHKYICNTCGGPKKETQSDKCIKCQNIEQKKNTKIEWPLPEAVLQMTEKIGFSATGRALGVSDNAVRKFLRRQ